MPALAPAPAPAPASAPSHPAEPLPAGRPGLMSALHATKAVPALVPSALAAETQRRFSSAQLFAGSVEVEIEHGACTYRLRRTALGKLILTK